MIEHFGRGPLIFGTIPKSRFQGQESFPPPQPLDLFFSHQENNTARGNPRIVIGNLDYFELLMEQEEE